MEKTTTTKPAASSAEKALSIEGLAMPTPAEIQQINQAVERLFRPLFDEIDSSLSLVERMRKLGSGVRRYGFIDKTMDIASDNLQFAPQVFNLERMRAVMRDVEELRNLMITLTQCQRTIADLLLVAGDDAFQMALLYYGAVRDLARRRVPGAEGVFNVLRIFFQRTRARAGGAEEQPTEQEVESDVRALLHGSKSGKIVVENEAPHLEGGTRKVLDDAHRGRAVFKESNEVEVKN